MSEKNPIPHVLKTPSGPGITPEEAYLAAVTSLPRLISDIGKVLTGIVEQLDDIGGSIDTVALYCERRGVSEKLFKPDDFSQDGSKPDEKSGE